MPPTFHRHHALGHSRTLHLARPRTIKILLDTAIAFDAAHHIPRTRTEPATAPSVFAQLGAKLQRTHARSHPPLLAAHRIRRRHSFVDSRSILVLLVHPR